MLQAGSELFEFDERGFFDEGDDEWIFRKEDYVLEYEEGEEALSAKPFEKPELNLGKCDCGAPWDHDGICNNHEEPVSPKVAKKTKKKNGRRRK